MEVVPHTGSRGAQVRQAQAATWGDLLVAAAASLGCLPGAASWVRAPSKLSLFYLTERVSVLQLQTRRFERSLASCLPLSKI